MRIATAGVVCRLVVGAPPLVSVLTAAAPSECDGGGGGGGETAPGKNSLDADARGREAGAEPGLAFGDFFAVLFVSSLVLAVLSESAMAAEACSSLSRLLLRHLRMLNGEKLVLNMSSRKKTN